MIGAVFGVVRDIENAASVSVNTAGGYCDRSDEHGFNTGHPIMLKSDTERRARHWARMLSEKVIEAGFSREQAKDFCHKRICEAISPINSLSELMGGATVYSWAIAEIEHAYDVIEAAAL